MTSGCHGVTPGVPFRAEVMSGGQWWPICSSNGAITTTKDSFEDNNHGATKICNTLGFAQGTATHASHNMEKAMPVGACNSGEDITSCTGGGNHWAGFDGGVGDGLNVPIECTSGSFGNLVMVTCTGTLPELPDAPDLGSFGRRLLSEKQEAEKLLSTKQKFIKEGAEKTWNKAKEVLNKANELKDKTEDKANELKDKAKDRVKEVAIKVCNAALRPLQTAVDTACNGVDAAVQLAQDAVDALNTIVQFATDAIDKALDAIKELTDYVISSIGFMLASTLEPEVSLNFAILNTHKQSTTEYEISLSLKGIQFKKIAQDAFSSIFEPIKDAAVKVVTDLKDKVATPTTHVANIRCGQL